MKTRKSAINGERRRLVADANGTSLESNAEQRKVHAQEDDEEGEHLVCSICNFKSGDDHEMNEHMKSHVQRKVKTKTKGTTHHTDRVNAIVKEELETVKCEAPEEVKNESPCGEECVEDVNPETKPLVENKGNKLLELVQKLRLNVIGDKSEGKLGDDDDRMTDVKQENYSVDNVKSGSSSVEEVLETCKVNAPNIDALVINIPEKTFRKNTDRRSQSTTQRTTGGKKCFECDVCGYRAKWLSELQKHKLVHTNEKPFPCPHCTHRSRWKGDLTRHIQKIHKIFIQPQRSRKSAKSKLKEAQNSDKIVILPANKPMPMTQSLLLPSNGNFIAFPGMLPVENSKKSVTTSESSNKAAQSVEIKEVATDSVSCNPILLQKLNSEPQVKINAKKIVSSENQNKEQKCEVSTGDAASSPNSEETVIRKIVYKCKECSFYTKTASRFHVHVVQHLNKKPYMCSECGYRSNWQWDVTKHIRVKISKMNSHKSAEVLLIDEAGEKNYEKYKPYMELVEERLQTVAAAEPKEVKITTKTNQNIAQMDAKEESQIDEDTVRYNCKQCGFKDNNQEVIKDHVITHLTKYVINGANKSATKEINPDELQFRIIEDLNGDIFVCSNCPYKTRKREFINFHICQHFPRPDAPYQCIFCPYWVSLEKNMLKHLSLHVTTPSNFLKEVEDLISIGVGSDGTNESKSDDDLTDNSSPKRRKFSCDYCPYTSNNRSQYLYHKQFHEKGLQKLHNCPHCSYSVSHLHLLHQHLKLHENQIKEGENYEDTLDDKNEDDVVNSTTDEPDNGNSGQTGQIVKMFKCRYCPLVNKRRANVKTHELMHTKAKLSQYTCDLCNYKCDGQGALTSHLKIHDQTQGNYQLSQRKPDCGDQVQAVYLDEANVPRQRIKSSNATISKCAKCPSVFKTATHLLNHERLHGSNFQFACNFCDYAAKFKPHLQNHVKVHLVASLENNSTGYDASEPPSNETPEKIDDGVSTFEMNNEATANDNNFINFRSAKSSAPFQCSKCPARFNKNVRLRRHELLHGAFGKFTCQLCAYSVNNSIAYQKHRQLHCKTNVNDNSAQEQEDVGNAAAKKMMNSKQVDHREWLQQSAEHVRVEQEFSDSRIFSCSHCPYVHHRKDAVQNHLRRHIPQTGSFKCPHCDYNVLYDSFLREHIKLHFTLPHHFIPKFKAKIIDIEIKSTNTITNESDMIFRHGGNNDISYPETPDSSAEDFSSGDETMLKEEEVETEHADEELEVKAKDAGVHGKNTGPKIGHESDSKEEKHATSVTDAVDNEKIREAQIKYMEAMKNVSNIEDVFNVINEYLHSGGSVSCNQPGQPKPE